LWDIFLLITKTYQLGYCEVRYGYYKKQSYLFDSSAWRFFCFDQNVLKPMASHNSSTCPTKVPRPNMPYMMKSICFCNLVLFWVLSKVVNLVRNLPCYYNQDHVHTTQNIPYLYNRSKQEHVIPSPQNKILHVLYMIPL
jgi:hypothetical protein